MFPYAGPAPGEGELEFAPGTGELEFAPGAGEIEDNEVKLTEQELRSASLAIRVALARRSGNASAALVRYCGNSAQPCFFAFSISQSSAEAYKTER